MTIGSCRAQSRRGESRTDEVPALLWITTILPHFPSFFPGLLFFCIDVTEYRVLSSVPSPSAWSSFLRVSRQSLPSFWPRCRAIPHGRVWASKHVVYGRLRLYLCGGTAVQIESSDKCSPLQNTSAVAAGTRFDAISPVLIVLFTVYI